MFKDCPGYHSSLYEAEPAIEMNHPWELYQTDEFKLQGRTLAEELR